MYMMYIDIMYIIYLQNMCIMYIMLKVHFHKKRTAENQQSFTTSSKKKLPKYEYNHNQSILPQERLDNHHQHKLHQYSYHN